MDYTPSHVLHDVNPYYGLISVPQNICDQKEYKKYRSTVYPIQSTLFYIGKTLQTDEHVHAIVKCN